MQREIRGHARRKFRVGRLAAWLLVVVMLSAAALVTTAAVSGAGVPRRAGDPAAAYARVPASTATVLSGAPPAIAARVAQLMFSSAPVVVIADARRLSSLAGAARLATAEHGPLLLMALSPGGAGSGPGTTGSQQVRALRTTLKALKARAVVTVGIDATTLSAQLPRVDVVADVAALPAGLRRVRLESGPVRSVAVLVCGNLATYAAEMAAAATARAAGARTIRVRGYDPRADPAAIAALAKARPGHVLAIGSGFGPAAQLAARIAVAETGVQLPGGGQVLFPAHRLVALYGHPGVPGLGSLGQQDLAASIARARQMAAPYRQLGKARVVPAFEIIATIAEGSPGPDGSYSYESSVASLRPWVRRATAAGMYVILDLQPGRDNFLAQAKVYTALLELPNVGLALDPEWKLQPGQLPLHQIGSVSIGEVNSVVTWLARLTARYRLPQKLLELHEFRLSMIQNEKRLDTRHDDLAIVINMDGQGSPGSKQQTWDAVTGAAPHGVRFGWKDFFLKDHPMLNPAQTMAHKPRPVLISYQ
jgi:hypothetical protein